MSENTEPRTAAPGPSPPEQSEPQWPEAEGPEAQRPEAGWPEPQRPEAERPEAERPEATGHPAVDAALRALTEVADAAPAAQLPAYQAAHRTLRETLASIDEG